MCFGFVFNAFLYFCSCFEFYLLNVIGQVFLFFGSTNFFSPDTSDFSRFSAAISQDYLNELSLFSPITLATSLN
jgi:hypothetical protein